MTPMQIVMRSARGSLGCYDGGILVRRWNGQAPLILLRGDGDDSRAIIEVTTANTCAPTPALVRAPGPGGTKDYESPEPLAVLVSIACPRTGKVLGEWVIPLRDRADPRLLSRALTPAAYATSLGQLPSQ